MLSLGGLSFEVGPEDALSPEENRSLGSLAGAGSPGDRSLRPFRIEITPRPPWNGYEPTALPQREPALVDWRDGRVSVSHRDFASELDPIGLSGRLFRRTRQAFPLELTLRVALASRLPLAGGLPLHAAGVLTHGQGLVFFGPSGAGKSTLAGLCPHPVLSDELVAVLPDRPFRVSKTGFFGTLGRGDAPDGAFPLRALIELDKGPRYALAPLSPATALRRLLGVILVPVGPPLWSAALAVAGRLAREVPAFRMTWSPGSPPWDRLDEALGRADWEEAAAPGPTPR